MSFIHERSGYQGLIMPFALTLLFFLTLLSSLPHETQAETSPAFPTAEMTAEEKDPTFKTPEALKRFKEGGDLFSEKNWKDAIKAFQEVVKQTSDKASRKIVDAYLQAAKGGKNLDRINKDIKKKKWRKAWSGWLTQQKKYGDTPLSIHLEELHKVIYPELFFDLATFETDPPEPEKKAREAWPENETRLTKDPDVIHEGEGALVWSAGNTGGGGFAGGAFGNFAFGRLPLASLEEVIFDDYRWLNFSIYNEDDNFGKYVIYFGTDPIQGGNQAWANAGGLAGFLRNNCYSHQVTIRRKGWNHFRVDLARELKKDPNLTWTDIQSMMLLTVPPSHKKTLVIDAIKLERP